MRSICLVTTFAEFCGTTEEISTDCDDPPSCKLIREPKVKTALCQI